MKPLQNLATVLFVKDISVSKHFYSNILGEEIKLDFGKNVIYKSGFAIWEIRETHIIPSSLGLNNLYDRSINRFELCFETEDIDSVFDMLKHHEIRFLHEIIEEIWGQRTIRFFDPDNHLIEIGERLEQFVIRFHKQGLTIDQVSERTFVPIAEVERIVKHFGAIEIQLAKATDLAAILRLQKECFRSEAELVHDFSIPPMTQDMDAIEQEFSVSCFLRATIDGNIIGSVRAHSTGTTCYIGKLIVHPAHQSKGLGQKLMKAIESSFRESKRFELFTSSKSAKNLHLYDKLGYREYKREVISDELTLIYLEKENL